MTASEQRLYFLIQRSAHALKKQADTILLNAGGLTTAQGAVMAILISDGPSAHRHIASRLSQRESAITTMADRLMKAGFAVRERSTTDRRAWVLEATDEGRAAYAAMQAAFVEVNAALDDAFAPDEIESLARGLRDLLAGLETRSG